MRSRKRSNISNVDSHQWLHQKINKYRPQKFITAVKGNGKIRTNQNLNWWKVRNDTTHSINYIATLK